MEIPLQITFHSVEPSDALSELVRQHAEKLEALYPRLVGCRVAVEEPNNHHRHGKGRQFRVRIELSVPGDRLIAERDVAVLTGGGDAALAVNSAFEAARRQLQGFAKQNGWERPHERRAKRSRPWIAS